MVIDLYQHQLNALRKMHNGCILCGGVGSGKSRTALAYYFTQEGGGIMDNYVPLPENHRKLFIITTARKRDTHEWEEELIPFAINPEEVVIDSWNNIAKYVDIRDSFFIFDEQRVVGWGVWSKSFVKIAHSGNSWILLSATPGDTWLDYAPVFIANGYFRNISEFKRAHVVYSRWSHFPKVEKYLETAKLTRLRNEILVNMPFERKTKSHHLWVECGYSKGDYHYLMKNRFNFEENRPIESASELCYMLRRVVNSDLSRIEQVIDIWNDKKKLIVFYNFDYELELLMTYLGELDIVLRQWNGHKHEKVPVEYDEWIYLVQYTAGAEGWNCTSTDTIVFYSLNYSYKIMTQAAGRIDRLNTPFTDLYFYHLNSKASIDIAIKRALKDKKTFNERGFVV